MERGDGVLDDAEQARLDTSPQELPEGNRDADLVEVQQSPDVHIVPTVERVGQGTAAHGPDTFAREGPDHVDPDGVQDVPLTVGDGRHDVLDADQRPVGRSLPNTDLGVHAGVHARHGPTGWNLLGGTVDRSSPVADHQPREVQGREAGVSVVLVETPVTNLERRVVGQWRVDQSDHLLTKRSVVLLGEVR